MIRMAAVSSRGTCIVRSVFPKDAERMLPLIRDHAIHEQREAALRVETLRDALSRRPPLLYAWAAEMQDDLVGYATATRDFSTWGGRHFLHLDCLFVRAGFRGSGIGALLFAAVRDHALRLKLPEMQWQTPGWNEGACRFYRRTGASSARKTRFTLEV